MGDGLSPKTILSWVNSKVIDLDIHVSAVDKDFQDGTALINLLQVLGVEKDSRSQKIGKYTKRPKMKIHRYLVYDNMSTQMSPRMSTNTCPHTCPHTGSRTASWHSTS